MHFIARLICARCLHIFSGEFNTNLHFIYVKGRDPLTKIERVKLKPIDIDKIYYTGSQIDLRIGIREAIMLSIPIAPICKNTCRGLCPVCGKNRNKYTCECTVEKVGIFTPGSTMKGNKKKPRKK